MEDFVKDIKNNMQKLKSDPNLQASDWLNEVPDMIGLKSYEDLIEKSKFELDQQPKDKLDMAWDKIQKYFKKDDTMKQNDAINVELQYIFIDN